MTQPKSITRRRFLQGASAAMASAAALPMVQQMGPALRRMSARLPWYRQSQKVTYTVCDMCP